MAALKGWPLAAEMEALGCADCAAFAEKLSGVDQDRWLRMRAERRIVWGGEPALPIAECVRNLLALIRHAVVSTRRAEPQRPPQGGRDRSPANANPRERGRSDARRVSVADDNAPPPLRVISRKEAMEWAAEFVGERHPDLAFEIATGRDYSQREKKVRAPSPPVVDAKVDTSDRTVKAPARQLGM